MYPISQHLEKLIQDISHYYSRHEENFIFPCHEKNFIEEVLEYQPIEKVMFAYKLLAVFGNHYNSSNSLDYAKAAKRLFDIFGITNYVVSGHINGQAKGEKHHWNIIVVDNQHFHFDAFFTNTERVNELFGVNSLETFIVKDLNYNFFCVSTKYISLTHVLDKNDLFASCQQNLSHELIRDLANMYILVDFDYNPENDLFGKIILSGFFPRSPKHLSPVRIIYTASPTPIPLSYEST